MIYQEPLLSILVLDFLKPEETLSCLGSIRSHVKIPHEVIYHHNGPAEHAYHLFEDGLVDRFIQTRKNSGLGLGTRDLFAVTFSPYALYLQNDQQLIRDIDDKTFRFIAEMLDQPVRGERMPVESIKSVSLAGAVGGAGIYSERCHLIKTSFYKDMEAKDILGHGGAGPYHEAEWRERSIQEYYRKHGFIHDTSLPSFVQDNGRRAFRQNPDGSVWEHRPDTKQLRLVSGPVHNKYTYPAFTEAEWISVLKSQSWSEWQIPEKERGNSFHVWN